MFKVIQEKKNANTAPTKNSKPDNSKPFVDIELALAKKREELNKYRQDNPIPDEDEASWD
jgi:hypothetical protein